MSVTFKYKGQKIGTMTEDGEKSLKTAGKYCEANIDVQYIDSGGMAGIHFGTNSPPETSLGIDGEYYYQRINWRKCFERVNATIKGSNVMGYGTEFKVTQSVTVTHLFAMTVENRTGKIQLGTTSEILAETENVLFPANEWVEVPLASPIQLSTDTNYVVKVVIDSTYSTGKIGWVDSYNNLPYKTPFSYVGLRVGTNWPGTTDRVNGVLVGIGYLNSDGLYRIAKQFYKSSGVWSEIT